MSEPKEKIAAAKLIIAVFDSSCALSDEDREIFDLCSGKSCLAVINKTDLEPKIDEDEIKRNFENVVYISAKDNSGLDLLRETIEKNTRNGKFRHDRGSFNERKTAVLLRKGLFGTL